MFDLMENFILILHTDIKKAGPHTVAHSFSEVLRKPCTANEQHESPRRMQMPTAQCRGRILHTRRTFIVALFPQYVLKFLRFQKMRNKASINAY